MRRQVAEDSGPTIIGVLFNDTDPENQALEITAVTQGANGTVVKIGTTGVSVPAESELLRQRLVHLQRSRTPAATSIPARST